MEVASILNVCSKTVKRIVDRFLATGDVEPSQRRNGPERELHDFEEIILIQQLSCTYLHELQDVVATLQENVYICPEQ